MIYVEVQLMSYVCPYVKYCTLDNRLRTDIRHVYPDLWRVETKCGRAKIPIKNYDIIPRCS